MLVASATDYSLNRRMKNRRMSRGAEEQNFSQARTQKYIVLPHVDEIFLYFSLSDRASATKISKNFKSKQYTGLRYLDIQNRSWEGGRRRCSDAVLGFRLVYLCTRETEVGSWRIKELRNSRATNVCVIRYPRMRRT